MNFSTFANNTTLALTTNADGFLVIAGVVSEWKTADSADDSWGDWTLQAFLNLALCAKRYDPSHTFWSGWSFGDEGEEQTHYRTAHETLEEVCFKTGADFEDLMMTCVKFGRATMGRKYWG